MISLPFPDKVQDDEDDDGDDGEGCSYDADNPSR